MSVRILRAGLQTTIQATPRSGLRHLGVPQSGPADPPINPFVCALGRGSSFAGSGGLP